jgi:hypothetical protein
MSYFVRNGCSAVSQRIGVSDLVYVLRPCFANRTQPRKSNGTAVKIVSRQYNDIVRAVEKRRILLNHPIRNVV